MLCERCNQNNATLYVGEYSYGKIRKSYICSECAKKQKTSPEMIQPAFENFLMGILEMALDQNIHDSKSKPLESPILVCPSCEMTTGEFRKNGRFGCMVCYETFKDILENALKKIQPSNTHVGKVPKHLETVINNKSETENLKEELNVAIKEERYEEAAQLRDRIKALEKAGNQND